MPACLRAFQPPKAKKTLTFNGKLLANADELNSACMPAKAGIQYGGTIT